MTYSNCKSYTSYSIKSAININISILLFRLENQFIAMNNLLSDVKIHRHVSKREVKEQSHVNKRNAENDDEKVTSAVFR